MYVYSLEQPQRHREEEIKTYDLSWLHTRLLVSIAEMHIVLKLQDFVGEKIEEYFKLKEHIVWK